jgi:putative endonuclease
VAGRSRLSSRGTLGRRAEELAAVHLRAAGLEIVARNWRRPEGELDIVALDPDGTCVFCEVRSRTGEQSGTALEAVDFRKRAQVIRAARLYLSSGEVPAQVTGFRFDVIAITFTGSENQDAQVTHVRRAFETPD